MDDKNVSIGGFPAIHVEQDLYNYGGIICKYLLHDSTIEIILKESTGLTDKSYLVPLYRKKLPQLFALMHFHIEYLKNGVKANVVISFKSQEYKVLGWFEVRDYVIYYYYWDPFKQITQWIKTGYVIYSI